jgi:hypothetical protein
MIASLDLGGIVELPLTHPPRAAVDSDRKMEDPSSICSIVFSVARRDRAARAGLRVRAQL